ncbi:unnamed protein product [Notodromas monacha]|uniref:Uncharacterized protein n=1 Tax=Notodromas monacha TaxID=399045 RepID=A0A7R9BNB5_9CRUS|nr:unnamed protein product [Notodromas monacha]CAG0917153.1 unnamed protein product [Notodromas monacha]
MAKLTSSMGNDSRTWDVVNGDGHDEQHDATPAHAVLRDGVRLWLQIAVAHVQLPAFRTQQRVVLRSPSLAQLASRSVTCKAVIDCFIPSVSQSVTRPLLSGQDNKARMRTKNPPFRVEEATKTSPQASPTEIKNPTCEKIQKLWSAIKQQLTPAANPRLASRIFR